MGEMGEMCDVVARAGERGWMRLGQVLIIRTFFL